MQTDLSRLKTVLFDWDNTLAETRSSLVTSINIVLEEFKMPVWAEVKKLHNPNVSFRDNFINIFQAKAEAAYLRYREIYKEIAPQHLSVFPNVQNTIDFLKERNIKIAIMSNKDRQLLEFELPLLFNPEDFDKIVCGHEAPRDKPFPEHALYTLEGLTDPENINPESVWIVGDSKQDSDCALAAGVLPIRIGQPIWNDENFRDKRLIFFENFTDFLTYLRNIK